MIINTNGGDMHNRPDEGGGGLVEWILIIILIILVLVTVFLLLRPALTNFWQEFLLSLQQ